MITRLRHAWLALVTLPGVLFSRQRRALFREMRAFTRSLPDVLKAPLPDAMKQIASAGVEASAGDRLTPRGRFAEARLRSEQLDEQIARNLADVVVLLDRRSPLGLCLRRSLTRYHFLRRAGVPVVVHFGAKFVNGQADRDIAGHAWLSLNGQAYHESDENWRGFTVMLSFPQDNGKITT